MCRFLAWAGVPRYLDEFVLNSGQSLVVQSHSALIGKAHVNADGFGLAWYGERETPCIYKDIHPAWSDANLKQIASHTKAGLFLAHVRASTSTAVSRNNCHPFARGEWSFMHNGQVGGHLHLRQRLDGMIPSDCYEDRFGATDSEAIFLIAAGDGTLEVEPARAPHGPPPFLSVERTAPGLGRLEVRAGLELGDRVVTLGLSTLQPGDTIAVADPR